MLKFIRENVDIIVKFLVTHLVMSVLGIMVGLSVLSFENASEGMSSIAIIASVFTVGFMCFMHYDDMYFCAVKEGIRIRSEGGERKYIKGLYLTLVAYSPVIIVGFIAIIIDLTAGGVENASPIALLIYYFCQGSFLCLYRLREAVGVTGYVLITLLPAIISSTLGYVIGIKDKTIRGMMGFNVKPPYDGPMERKPKNKNDK